MADIKRCPVCKGRPQIRRGTFGYTYSHMCERDGEKELIKCVEPFASWGAAVRGWNETVKELKENGKSD